MACVHVSCGPRGPGRRQLPRATHLFLPGRAALPCQGRRRQPWQRRERGWKCAVVCPRGQGCLARGSADWCRRCWSVRADRATSALRADQALLIARAVSKRASIKPWRAMQVKILPVRLASLAASSILHGGLMWSSLRPRVMCVIRDSSHTHMHTQNTHTHTHTHTRTRTHTHTHKYTHTPTPTPVARSCVCVAMSSLSLSKSLSLSLSGCACVCLRGR